MNRTKENYFQKILKDSGVIVKDDNNPYILTKPQSIVIYNINKALTDDKQYPCNVYEFLSGLHSLNTHKAMQPADLIVTGLNNVHEKQNSLFQIFLNVDCLQRQLLETLLERIVELDSDESEDDRLELILILKNLSYLPFIKNVEEFIEKLLDAVEVGSNNVQLEILLMLPNLLPANCCNEAMIKQLCKLIEEHNSLTGVIIDCFNYFDLTNSCSDKIEEFILKKMLSSSHYYNIFPILMEFLLCKHQNDNASDVLMKIRDPLNKLMTHDAEKEEIKSYKAMMFSKLEVLLVAQNNLFDGFIKLINNIKDNREYKPIDLFILFMLNKSSKKVVQMTFKKLFKKKVLSPVLFEELLMKCYVQHSFDYCFDSYMDICMNMFGTLVDNCYECFTLIIRKLFTHNLCSQLQRYDLLLNLSIMGRGNNITYILKVIHKMIDEPILKNYRTNLMIYLDRLNTMGLKDVKLLFNIVCYLICNGDADDNLKDDLLKIIRKEVSAYCEEVKYRGIIASVIIAKHLACISEEDVDCEKRSVVSDVAELPAGPIKEAGYILEFARKRIQDMPEMLVLYYDELSEAIRSEKKLNMQFLTWLLELITDNFQELFVANSTPASINDIHLTTQYCLNDADEMEQYIAINIGGLVLQENLNIVILPSIFRLLQVLHHRCNNANLSNIDALLGCPVILPKVEKIEELSTSQMKQVADCTFLCINWFRELVNAFLSQADINLQKSVLKRLSQLIELEEMFHKCMSLIPEDKVPTTNSDSKLHETQQVISQTPKKKKAKLEHCSFDTDTVILTNQGKNKKKVEGNYKFRTMGTNVISLLNYPLEFGTEESKRVISPKQLQFILKAVIEKIELSLKCKLRDLSLTQINIISAEQLIGKFKEIMYYVHMHYKTLVDNKSVDNNASISLILKLYSLIFGWQGFQEMKNFTLLLDYFKSFKFHNSQSPSLLNYQKYVGEFITNITTIPRDLINISSAVSILQIIDALNTSPLKYKSEIMPLAESFLKHKWNEVNNEQIDYLIKIYLGECNLKMISDLVDNVVKEGPETMKTKKDHLSTFTCINKSNFYLLFANLCSSLSSIVRSDLPNTQQISEWNAIMTTLQKLTQIVKAQSTRSNLRIFLKKSIDILKTFISAGIPIMETMLKTKTKEVLGIISTLQENTRFLHKLCCYSKIKKDRGLICAVPQFRLTLETLIYRIKAILVANGYSDAFWMGILRNKNLEGKIILSQISTSSEEESFILNNVDNDDDDDDDMAHVSSIENEDVEDM